MAEQRPDAESDGNSNDSIRVGQPQPRPEPERFFQNEIHDAAARYGWRPFHLRDKDSIHIVRGRGFPDLVMWRRDHETGKIDLLAAELKRDAEIRPTSEQREWIQALGQHIPTYIWSPDGWDEIDNILRHGTNGQIGSPDQPRAPRARSPIPYNFGDVIANIIETVEDRDMSTGNKASLRRMDPEQPNSPLFWKLMSYRGIPNNADVKKWGLIMHGIALMSHRGRLAHNPRIRVGQALYEGNRSGRMPFYSEDRLSALLAARDKTLRRILARLFRMLGNQDCAFNWREMAWFILNEGTKYEERADEARMEIAKAYYRAEYSSTESSNQNDQGDNS